MIGLFSQFTCVEAVCVVNECHGFVLRREGDSIEVFLAENVDGARTVESALFCQAEYELYYIFASASLPSCFGLHRRVSVEILVVFDVFQKRKSVHLAVGFSGISLEHLWLFKTGFNYHFIQIARSILLCLIISKSSLKVLSNIRFWKPATHYASSSLFFWIKSHLGGSLYTAWCSISSRARLSSRFRSDRYIATDMFF